MSIIDSVFGRILETLREMKITSAGGKNPTVKNEVYQPVNINTTGLTQEFNAEVIRVIQEEITIQMTKLEESPPSVSTPEGSALTKVQGDVGKAMGLLKNPGGFVAAGLKVLPPAAAALFAYEISKYVFAEITKPGGQLDLRWKRQMQNEFNAFLSRQNQRNTQIGTRQVVIQSNAGFMAINGAANENTLRQIREGGVNGNRLARIDLTDHAEGLF